MSARSPQAPRTRALRLRRREREHRRRSVELMVTGRLYDEGTVLRVGLAYERATKWHTVTPKLT